MCKIRVSDFRYDYTSPLLLGITNFLSVQMLAWIKSYKDLSIYIFI